MAKKNDDDDFMKKIGPLAFVLGLIISFLAAVTGTIFWLLGVLGIVVGLLNITYKETMPFLIASLTFLVSVNVLSTTITKLTTLLPFVKQWLNFIDPLLANIVLFVAPGAGLVALKTMYNIAKD